MNVCVECGHSMASLYQRYGSSIKLSQCPICRQFADKYLEYDLIIIFIDLLLHKPSAYRHLLFNRISYVNGLNENLVKIGILFLLFEVYMKWFRLDQLGLTIYPQDASVVVQYLVTLTISVSEFLVMQCSIRSLLTLIGHQSTSELNRVSMALIVSSFGKVLLILLVVWDYGSLDPTALVSLLVFTSNLEALSVLLNVNILSAGMILCVGHVAKACLHRVLLYYDPGLAILFT